MILHVFANRSNIGDLLSAQGIQSLLEPHAVKELLCDRPFVASTLEALQAAGPDDLVVIGGGGLFMDYFSPFWIGLPDVARRTPVCIWGVGCCDLKYEPSLPDRSLIQECVRLSRLCVVRDDLTRRFVDLEQVGAPVPCPSMMLVSEAPSGSGVLHVDNYTTAGAVTYEHMDRLAREFANATGRPFSKTNNRIGRSQELKQVLAIYAASDLVISSALHGCIVGVAMGKKVCAVSGDRKIDEFMHAAGLGEWVLDAREVGRLAELLARIDDQQPVPDFVAQARAENRKVAETVLAFVRV